MDSQFEALNFNSGLRADMRVKAASLLAEESREIIALVNDPQAPKEIRDRYGEKFARVIERIYDPGTEITGQSQAAAPRIIDEYFGTAIAETVGPVLAAQNIIRGLEAGGTPSKNLVAQAQRNGNTPLHQSRLNAMQSAEDIGYLLGVVEAGQSRGIETTVARQKKQEDTVKAFMDVVLGAATAPIPGGGGN